LKVTITSTLALLKVYHAKVAQNLFCVWRKIGMVQSMNARLEYDPTDKSKIAAIWS